MNRFPTRTLLQGRLALPSLAAALPFPRAVSRLQAGRSSSQAPKPASSETKIQIPFTPLPPKDANAASSLPYTVRRTASNWLPVYPQSKAGGSLKETLIKNVEGDKKRLAENLIRDLGLQRGEAKINPVTGHIVIKGHRREAVLHYLSQQGF